MLISISVVFFTDYFFQNVKELLYTCYQYKYVENIGVEPMTSCVQGRRSSQLS
jgi:hypothetical protein